MQLFLLIFALIASSLMLQQDGEWKEFSPEGGNFSISLPGKPSEEIEKVNLARLTTTDAHRFRLFHDGTLFIIYYLDIPEILLQQTKPGSVFNSDRDGTIKYANGRLVNEEAISLNGYHGRAFTITNEEKVINCRQYQVGQRFYKISTEARKETSSAAAERFLSSFALLAAPSANVAIAWHEFASKSGNFSAVMPGTPRKHTNNIIINAVPWSFKGFMAADNDVFYIASYSDLPNFMKQAQPDEILDRFSRDEVIQQAGVKLLHRSVITSNEYPGRELMLQANSGAMVRVRYHLINYRLYQLYAYSKSAGYLENIDKFFNSFHPLEKIVASDSAAVSQENDVIDDELRIKNSEAILRSSAIETTMPVYPQEARSKNITGEVVVRLFINETGAVTEVMVIDGHPMLRDAAVAAAKQWRFKPALLKDKTVKVIGHLTFRFSQ